MTRPDDFRAAVRRGRRVPTGHTVMHVLNRAEHSEATALPARFGFIVTKAVGGAVTRNTVKRRLRAASHAVLPTVAGGTDVVIRALPGSDAVAWTTLHSEIADGLRSQDRGLGNHGGSVAR